MSKGADLLKKLMQQVDGLPVAKFQSKKLDQSSRPFVDWKIIRVVGGSGGEGGISFTKEAHKPLGEPSGGDGGSGGDVYLEVDESCTDLSRLNRVYRGGKGKTGRGSMCSGENGDCSVVKVPLGTVVRRVRPPASALEDIFKKQLELEDLFALDRMAYLEKFYKFADDRENFSTHTRFKILLARLRETSGDNPFATTPPITHNSPFDLRGQVEHLDLSLDELSKGQRYLLARGGTPGKGNNYFAHKFEAKVPFQRRGKAGSKLATRGSKGDDCFYELELKILAEVALVGLPNVGKSSLLKALTKARPKIAPYAFTTLVPYVGILEFPRSQAETVSIADIPGLVENASDNVGLGHEFLRHIERAKKLIIVLDASSTLPLHTQTRQLVTELEHHKAGLSSKAIMVIINKMDLVCDMEELERGLNELTSLMAQVKELRDLSTVLVSVADGRNLDSIVDRLYGAFYGRDQC